VGSFINNVASSSSYSSISWLGKYATEWALVRGTFDWGVLDEKRTHPKTDIEGPKLDSGVIPFHNCVGAVAHVRRKRESKGKLLSVQKRIRANNASFVQKTVFLLNVGV
jgi:hypothetical protein